ncbi:MAG: hypothetical protein NTY15_12645 [Planctomycetota bacterium]|nr:hypothetical protein [Planctomycetota bacterium]
MRTAIGISIDEMDQSVNVAAAGVAAKMLLRNGVANLTKFDQGGPVQFL